MKLYLNCYVWGDGYTTKCFDTVTKDVTVGSHTMNEQEKVLFIRSNARLLLASVGTRRFGFVRQIDAGTTDENGRKCMINLALAGNEDEVDGIITMAAKRYREFAQTVRGMIYYEGSDFKLDWKKFQILAGLAGQVKRNRNSSRPVVLLCAEPSLGYFIKNCGMEWKESDIEMQFDLGTFSEKEMRSMKMRLYIYCATPSMGYMLREIDGRTGEVLHEEKEARKIIPRELLAMIDNSGCRMASLRVGGRECFVAKEVKADAVNQYGQRTTVCLAVESTGDDAIVRQMAVRALLDYEVFRRKLTDCVKVSASTVGYTVDGEKLQQFMASVQAPLRFAPEDPRSVQRDTLMREKSRQYTFLVMDTSLDYFCRSTGLDVSKQQVFYICPENVLGASSGELAAAFRERNVQIGAEASEAGGAGSKSFGTKEFKAETESGTAKKAASNKGGSTAMEDAIDLLENPVIKSALGVFAFVLVVLLLGIMIYKVLHE